ncbi:putative aarF domain-containing protein kinase 5 [Monoraphidium neglectum]|uniref:Putative aarF domain-containing protein kinase 5 n=1 Tax=Monoraphidium neglectum TaxID=145388 RepID=A0A0D2K8E6_9CHLO|nr:putative aarF domain-containing protein kinase 5 [Monoraphidium neglectum]KIY92408.1 putative aarF domain-containing protein kinase 5 [Monoraphidium neglectum]|eukprot:XP_013891428.1 putative aarF domain-containing protein kinase 5 [Monoraphidium neglectum]
MAFPEFGFGWLYTELRHKLEEELDFSVEVVHSTRLKALLQGQHGVVVPRIHLPLCTSKVLVMEWISGHKVNDVRALRRARISAHAVGVKVEAAFAEMTFVHGYLHADPHPGNIMVRAKGRRGLGSYVGSGSWQPFEFCRRHTPVLPAARADRGAAGQGAAAGGVHPKASRSGRRACVRAEPPAARGLVVLLDHGCYLKLQEATRRTYCRLWCSLFAGDRAGAAAAAIELGGQRAGQILPIILSQRARTNDG